MSDDCQWSDQKTGTINYAYVPLGRKYALASGLMEITYDSGAHVILQGPCTYQVESKAGGYLSLGRLTATVTKKGEGGRGKGREADRPPSAIINTLPSRLHLPPSPFPLPPLSFALPRPLSPTLARSLSSRSISPAYPLARFPGRHRSPSGRRARQCPTDPIRANESVRVALPQARRFKSSS